MNDFPLIGAAVAHMLSCAEADLAKGERLITTTKEALTRAEVECEVHRARVAEMKRWRDQFGVVLPNEKPFPNR